LECTVHSTKYHCLIKLRSSPAIIAAEKTGTTTPSITNDDATITAITTKGTTNGNKTTVNDDRVIKPDISSLVIVPIRRTQRLHIFVEDERCVKRFRGYEKNDILDSSMNIIPLLPKLYFDTHCKATNNDNNGGLLKSSNDFTHDGNISANTSCIDEDHPCYELVTIAHKLQDQLKERLMDASNGAASADTATSIMIQNNTRHRNEGGISSSATMQEEFLLQSEAIIMELFSTIQQQLLRRKRSGVDHHHQQQQQRGVLSKRQTTATASSTTYKAAMKSSVMSSSSTIHHHHSPPPPLKYYSALSHQLHILQSWSSIKDISLHPHDGGNSTNKNNVDITSLSITCHDNSMRCHMWHVELYPQVVLTVDLPVEFGIENIVNSSNSSNNSINNNSNKSKNNNDNNNQRPIRLERWWEDDNDNRSSPTTTSFDDLTTATATTTTLLLPRIQQCFEITINKYQPLFNELDDIDANFWILEPTLPSRRCNVERRIALWEGGASLVIVLDPEYPRSVPVLVRFLGVTMSTMKAAASAGCGQGITSAISKNGNESSSTVNTGNNGIVDWRVSFAEFISDEEDEKEEEKGSAERGIKKKTNNLQQQYKNDSALDSNGTTKTTIQKCKWSDERSVRENLELWFGSSLPSPLVSSTTDKSDFLVECGICYTHRLPCEDDNGEGEEGPLPEIKCNNPSCSRHYHESCLFEWLHSLPMARVSFDRIFGSCMYCCEQISCPIAQQAK
jgi:E3 ubiquitin-protein ligase FANCL